jgi:hypothetical protein
MHLLPNVALRPNLELKTWTKQLLGSLPLVIVLTGEEPYPLCDEVILGIPMIDKAPSSYE